MNSKEIVSTGFVLDAWELDPAITYLITVQDLDLPLEEVAQTVQTGMHGDEDMFRLYCDWFMANMITVNPPEDPNLTCEAIRVEPYYIIKLTGQRYEN